MEDQGNYVPPIDRLLTYGDCRELPKWPANLEPGIGPEYIPDLIRMATDDALHQADPDSPKVWAPVHAWRALAQLRAEAAVEPLLSLLKRADESHDEWVLQELPHVFGMIGPPAISSLQTYLADESNGLFARTTAARCLEEIGKRYIDARVEAIASLTKQLEEFEKQDPRLNAFLIVDLVDLNAVEAAPVMERAFSANRVDEMIMGDWEDVQVELGLEVACQHARPIFQFLESPRKRPEKPAKREGKEAREKPNGERRRTPKVKVKPKRK